MNWVATLILAALAAAVVAHYISEKKAALRNDEGRCARCGGGLVGSRVHEGNQWCEECAEATIRGYRRAFWLASPVLLFSFVGGSFLIWFALTDSSIRQQVIEGDLSLLGLLAVLCLMVAAPYVLWRMLQNRIRDLNEDDDAASV